MDQRALLRVLSICRLAVGTAFVATPRLGAAGWIGADGSRTSVTVLARAFGVRDAAVGGGTLQALGGGGPVRPWLVAGIASDVTDLAATLSAGDRIPAASRALIVAVASGAIAIGAAALASVEDSGPAAA